jgi:hypothetical protein
MANPLAEKGRAEELLCWYDGKSYSLGSIINFSINPKTKYACVNKAFTLTEEQNAPNAMTGFWQEVK